MTLEEIVAELYGLPPGEFVAARTERVRQARDAGDKALATAIGTLRRPTVAAWAVNLLARTTADDIRALLDLGDALRDAQRRLSADQLRALGTQRQQVVNALTRKAADLAAARGQRLSESVLRDIGGTLQAALADPDIADQVAAGTLAAAASYEGFGPAALVAVPPARDRAERVTPSETTDRSDPASAAKELELTLADLESARAATASARTAQEAATSELSELETRLTRLRGEVADAEAQRRFALAAERSARDTLHRAEKHLAAAERRAEQARKQLPAS
ncbi:hypothetical protein JK358_22105 [Nocardia sp. 2]|uniref:Transposase n=1 Tax=Nocardia acididurans TaxID=2802282 RepID=A0ABS1M961_9NOCA|nr:hypothetical protein [Nocardia acididurans]MBL1077096.1 hypothetical protein [Nocardia acididurans]